MKNISTLLQTSLERAIEKILNPVADEGLLRLQVLLDNSGFADSPYLKDYNIISYVHEGEITFEILLNIESVVVEDTAVVEEENKEGEKIEKKATTIYVLDRANRRTSKMRDIRHPTTDARRGASDLRRPAKDARTTANRRLVKKELINKAPRSAVINRQGKLSLRLKRSVKSSEVKFRIPDNVEGIIKEIKDEISKLILEKFMPELIIVIKKYV